MKVKKNFTEVWDEYTENSITTLSPDAMFMCHSFQFQPSRIFCTVLKYGVYKLIYKAFFGSVFVLAIFTNKGLMFFTYEKKPWISFYGQ